MTAGFWRHDLGGVTRWRFGYQKRWDWSGLVRILDRGFAPEVTSMVATTTINQSQQRALVRRRTVDASGLRSNVGHFGLGTVGLLLIAISAWGGIVPFLGPTFGYSADGAGSWHWSLTHAVVSAAPGAVGILIGLCLLARIRGMVGGRRRLSLARA